MDQEQHGIPVPDQLPYGLFYTELELLFLFFLSALTTLTLVSGQVICQNALKSSHFSVMQLVFLLSSSQPWTLPSVRAVEASWFGHRDRIIGEHGKGSRSKKACSKSQRDKRINRLERVPVNPQVLSSRRSVWKTYPQNSITYPPLTPWLEHIVTKSLFSH